MLPPQRASSDTFSVDEGDAEGLVDVDVDRVEVDERRVEVDKVESEEIDALQVPKDV